MHRSQLKQKSKLVPCGHKCSACQVAWSTVGGSSAPLWQGSCSTCTVCVCEECHWQWQLWWQAVCTTCITTCTKVHSSGDNGQSVLLLFQKSCHVLDLSERGFSWPGIAMPGFGSRHCILSYSFSCSHAFSQLNDDPKIIPGASSTALELLGWVTITCPFKLLSLVSNGAAPHGEALKMKVGQRKGAQLWQ